MRIRDWWWLRWLIPWESNCQSECARYYQFLPWSSLYLVSGILPVWPHLLSAINLISSLEHHVFNYWLFPEPNLYNSESRSLQLSLVVKLKKTETKLSTIPRLNRKLNAMIQLPSQIYYTFPTYIWPMKNSVIYLAPLWNLPWENFCLEKTEIVFRNCKCPMLNAWALPSLIRHPVRWTA